MSRRIDFAKKRRVDGRSLSKAVRDITELVKPFAQQRGIDLEALLDQASARRSNAKRLLAERLQESVVPLFTGDRGGHPERIGSCVLVRVDSDFFAFTAAHLIRDADSATLFAPAEGRGGKLLPLPPCTAHLSPSRTGIDLDVGVLVLPASQLGPFNRRVFLAGNEIDRNDRPDDQQSASFYFVLGYSASRTQVKVSRAKRHITQRSFHCSTYPVEPAEYFQEKVSQADHILLDFDHNEIVIEGKRANPPKLQGVSGGGIFHISREAMEGPLVAIATRNPRRSRLIVGTRIKHFLAMVRELKKISDPRT
jgi:hypothetical protein